MAACVGPTEFLGGRFVTEGFRDRPVIDEATPQLRIVRQQVSLCRGRFPACHTTAALTQWIGGSASKRHSHRSPPSRPIQSWPVVVPK